MSRRWPRILNYHSVAWLDNDPNRTCTSPDRFEDHMLYLKSRNLRGTSVRELLRAWNSGDAKGLVGLAFDDGYEDFLHVALPILERFRFSATVFAVVGLLGKQNDWEHWYGAEPRMKLLGSEGLREISERGIEVGSHSMSHAKLPELDAESLEYEVGESLQVLGETLGEEIEGFCYPYGMLDEPSVQAVRRARYIYACAVNARVERSAYDLPRIPTSQVDNHLRFAVKLGTHPHYRTAKKIYQRCVGKQEY